MIYLPDTNACISLLRQRQPQLIARWRSTKVADITLCSIVVYELRQRGSLPVQSGARRDGNPGIYGNPGNVDSATYRF
jgi:predicted nucleic acid-binding protein